MDDVDSQKEAMVEEMVALKKNSMWDLVIFPNGCKYIRCKWVFKKKISLDGSFEKYKVRLVANDYSKTKGIN